MPTELRTTGVDLRGLMTVLGGHLYSTPAVAIRECVQNAHDSITRRRLEAGTGFEPRITVRADPAAATITITDTGAGLTEPEIHQYLATVGVGYTRSLREATGSDELIGAFGLGFLAAVVVARQVTVSTTSYAEPDRGWCYRTSNGERYTVEAIPARPVGTAVELSLDRDHAHLAQPAVLREILGRYCALLTHPVLIEPGDGKPVNAEAPPWRALPQGGVPEHPVQARRRKLAFASRFEPHVEPVCVIDVLPDGASDAVGLLWVQGGSLYGTSDNRNVSVFVRGMLLDDDARDLLPVWAGFAGGVIESSRLTPTASREDLKRDEHYGAVRAALAEALVTGLVTVARTQPEAWRRVLSRHNEALLGAALCDDRLFDLLADQVQIPTSQGDLRPAALRSGGRIHITLGPAGGFEDMLFRSLQVPVARGDRYAVLPFLRRYCESRGGTLVELGTEHGNRHVFQGATMPAAAKAWLTERLAAPGEELIPARFAPAELPLVLVPNREAELKRRLESDAADRRISSAALRLARAHTATIDGTVSARLYVNLDAPAVRGLLDAWEAGAAGVEPAAALLRSLKTIMGAGAVEGGGDLLEALRGVSEAVGELVGRPAATATAAAAETATAPASPASPAGTPTAEAPTAEPPMARTLELER